MSAGSKPFLYFPSNLLRRFCMPTSHQIPVKSASGVLPPAPPARSWSGQSTTNSDKTNNKQRPSEMGSGYRCNDAVPVCCGRGAATCGSLAEDAATRGRKCCSCCLSPPRNPAKPAVLYRDIELLITGRAGPGGPAEPGRARHALLVRSLGRHAQFGPEHHCGRA